jgi:hypothetical protein
MQNNAFRKSDKTIGNCALQRVGQVRRIELVRAEHWADYNLNYAYKAVMALLLQSAYH